MDNKQPDKPNEEKADKDLQRIERRSSKILNVLAFPISGIVGGYYTDLTTRKRVYMNFRQSTNMFKAGNEVRKNKYHDLVHRAQAGLTKDAAAEAHEIENVYRATVAEGEFHKIGMKSFKDFFRALETHQKAETIFFAATVTGVTLGSLLSIANNLDWLRKIFGKEPTDSGPSLSK